MNKKAVVLMVCALVFLLSIEACAQFILSVQAEASEETLRIYNFIKSLPTGSIIILSFDYGPSTTTENSPQARVTLFHAKQLGHKVVALAFWPSGAPIGDSVLKEVYGSAFPNIPEYGTSVVFLGYVPGNEVGMQTFGDNTWNAKGTDHYGTAIGTLPLMQQCRSAADFDFWMEIMSGDPGTVQVIQFVQARHGGPSAVPVGAGCTEVSYSGIKPYYVSGQLVGILKGYQGAFEYEWLLMSGITALIDIHPQVLNFRSKCERITVYIEFPEGHNVKDINVSSILLNYTVPATPGLKHIGARRLAVEFGRSEVIAYILANVVLETKSMHVALTVIGYLNDGTPFQGSDTIKITMPMPRHWRLIQFY